MMLLYIGQINDEMKNVRMSCTVEIVLGFCLSLTWFLKNWHTYDKARSKKQTNNIQCEKLLWIFYTYIQCVLCKCVCVCEMQ